MNAKHLPTRCARIKTSLLWRSLLAALLTMDAAQGQSITGGLYGSGPAGGAATVVVSSPDTGFKRELKTDAEGRYSTSGLNPGRYTVTVQQDGRTLGERFVEVKPNTQTAVAAVSTASTDESATKGATLATVTVTGRAALTQVIPIDVSTPELSSHYSRELINDLPMPAAAGPESIALLRSNVRYDDKGTGLVQIGGASAAENRYYLNEFDTTNDRTSLGANYLPREAIQDTEVVAGNFGASWTNATGGIMAQTVRQGTNEFAAGYSVYFTPATSRLLMPRAHDIYRPDGGYYSFNSDTRRSGSATQYVWASGALIKDKLFVFALFGDTPPWRQYFYGTNNGSRVDIRSQRDKNATINLTWNISEDQTFNLVGSRDWSGRTDNTYRLTQKYTTEIGKYYSFSTQPVRQRFLIGNYNWHIADNLDLRVMGGHLGNSTQRPAGNDALPFVQSYDSKSQITTNIGLNGQYNNFRPDDYWRTGYKGDLTWRLGDHKLVFGAEHYKHFLGEDWHYPQAGYFTYYDQPKPVQLRNGETVSGPYVEEDYSHFFGRMISVNKAAYLEDYWQATDRIVLYGGLRFDKYVQKDALERPLFSFPMTSPRLGISWDAKGDSSLKIGGNVGRYSISMPSNFSIGVAASNLSAAEWYRYTGVDPTTKAPLGLTQIGSRFTAAGQDGIPPSADQVATTNLKAPLEYMAQAYIQQRLRDNWVGQLDFGLTDLKRVINQTCWTQGIQDWANTHGYPNYVDPGNCFELNPGENVTVVRDFTGNGSKQQLTIPAAFFGLPKPKHKYYHLTLDLNHPRTADEPYYLDLSYTYTRSYGNDNGLLDMQSRGTGYIGQTGIYDFPEIALGSYGNLVNDVRHKVTASGAYYFQSGFRVSGVLNLHTGEPLTCYGLKPDVNSASYQYGDWGHYCNQNVNPVGVTPTGSVGRLPFFWQLDLGLGYDLSVGRHNKLSIDLDIQNVTNHRALTDRYQTFSADVNADNSIVPDVLYGLGTRYQTPRTTTLVFRYSFR